MVRELQAKDPFIFGSQGGSSRVFSTAEVVYSLGMTIGPLISGLLFEKVGFCVMNIVFGEKSPGLTSISLLMSIAIACVAMASLSFTWLDGKPEPSVSEPEA